MTHPKSVRYGVISDTHGHLPQPVFDIFENVDGIIHSGDIGGPDILIALKTLAPVCAVRGNMDYGPWAENLAQFEMIGVAQSSVYVLHDVSDLNLDPTAAGISAVVSGHTHRADIEYRQGVMYLNPGSASLPRYRTPATVAVLTVRNTTFEARIIEVIP